MKKLKLLLAVCTLFGGVSLGWAQTDVTNTYITNADFSSTDGWTGYSGGGSEHSEGFGLIGTLNLNNKPSTTDDNHLATEYCCGFSARWNGRYTYYQQIVNNLPPGYWTVSYDVQDVNTASTKYNIDSHFYVQVGDTKYADASTEWMNAGASGWTSHSISFDLSETSNITLSLGYGNKENKGSSDCPAVYVSHLKLTWTDPALAAAQTKLSGYIKKATALNGVLSDAALGTAITTAEGVLGSATTSSACNDASDDLSSAITTALSGLTPVALTNGNFDSSVDMNASGTHSAESINTTNAGAYEVSGWTANFGNEWVYGATSVYNTSSEVINGVASPASDMFSNTDGGTLHFSSGWNNQARYKQTVNNLPSGRYVFYYEANNQNSSATSIASNYFGVSGTAGDFYGTSNSFVYDETKSFDYNAWKACAFEFDVAKAANIDFHIGIVGALNGSGNGAKLWIDNVLVYRISDLMVEEADANQIIEDAEALNDAVYNATEKSDLATKLAAFKGNKSLENYSALNVSLGNAKASADHYKNDLKPIIDGLKDYATADLTAMDNDYNNGVYTSETDKTALIEQYQSIEIPALKAANATNYTSAIINPDFELDGKQVSKPTGWSCTHDGGDDGTRNGTVTNMSGWHYNKWQSWWDENFDIKQTIENLPNGQYTLSATLAGWSGCTVNLTANDKWTYIDGAGDGTGVDASVTCNVTDGTLNIRVNWGLREGGTFFKCDNFTLTYNGIKPMLAEAITEANAIYNNGANVGTGVFQIPTAAGTTFSNAISTTQGVYDNSGATASELQTAYDNLETAITTFLETEINEPEEGQLFNVVLNYPGWDYDQKAMTYMAGDRDNMGGYNIKYQAPANKNLAQAFTFTKVEGNNYKLSQIDADGKVRYMCTGEPYEGGNASQIRTTTNAEDAMQLTVIPTSVEEVYNLLNVAANEFIGSQDEGVFTKNWHIDFNIVETTKPSIAINTTTAGYGTTMLPFAVTSLPSGVKAYTCAEVDGTTLTLVEVTALAANKPYIIEGAWNETVSGDAQGTALTYTEGLLTGVYAETTAPVGSYVLQNLSTGLGFYKVAEGEGKQPKVGANHAYLTLPVQEQTDARALYFDNATAIRTIEALTSGEAEIYNTAGVRQNGLKKGVNIIKQGNKTCKVMVK